MSALQHTLKDTGTSMDLQLQNQQRSSSSSFSPHTKGSSIQPISKSGKPSSTSDDTIDNSALPRTAHWAARPNPTPPPAAPVKRKAKVLSLSSLSKPTVVTPVTAAVPATASTLPAKPKTPFATPSASALAASASSARAAKNGSGSGSGSGAASSTADVNAVGSRSRTTSTSSELPGGRPGGLTVLSRTASSTGSKPPPGLESTPTSAHPSLTSSPGIAEVQLPTEEVDGEAEGEAEAETPVPADVAVMTGGTATPQPAAEEKVEEADEESGSTETHTGTNVTVSDSRHTATGSISPAPSPLPASPPERNADGYQPSVQAQALIDDVRQRREPVLPVYQMQSPYPDFEDVLQCFSDGEFTYNLDVKLEVEEGKLANLMASVEDILAMGRAEAAAATPAYEGAFDPFVEPQLDEFGGLSMVRNASGGIEEDKKKGSRFGFANRSGPSDTNIPLLASVMGPASKLVPDIRAFSQLDMNASRAAQENRLNHPNYFAGLPGAPTGRPEAEMTPSSKSAMPYPQQSSSPAQTHRDQNSSGGSSMPPPPPGLGGPVNASTFPAYQQMNAGRSIQQAMEQQMMANMHGYQHQFQADGRRTASPGIQQAMRNGAGAGRFATGREGYASNEGFPFQDSAILRMGPPTFTSQNRNMHGYTPEQQPHLYDMNPSHSPYQHQPPQQQQQQTFSESVTPNARLLQSMHEQMARASSPGMQSRSAAAARQTMKMY